MNHDAAIRDNLAKANAQLNKINGSHPTEVVQAAMSVGHAFLFTALIEAVRELTDEVRKTREGE